MDNALLDERIRAALAADDPVAIDLLWQRYATQLFGFLLSTLRSRHDAEDVLQDVFVSAARHRSKLVKARNLNAYLFRMARNGAVDLIRRRGKDQALMREDDTWLAPEDRQAAEPEGVEQLTESLALLPEKQRAVMVLKVYEEMTFSEIAAALRISPNTAASRYRYGLEKMKQLMRSDAP